MIEATQQDNPPAPDKNGQAGLESARKRRRRRIRWTVRIVVVVLVAGYLKFVGLDGQFYFPDNKTYDRPKEYGLACEDVSFPTGDGLTLHGWFLPAKIEAGQPAKGLVIHFHGNAANVSAHLGLIEWLPERGYHVLMFDYRGYGRSEGRVTRAGTVRDGHAAVDYAKSRPEAQDVPLLAYGQSLGGAVAVVVAAERPEIRAVVAESTFGDYRGIAARHVRRLVYFDWLSRLMARAAISDGYDPLDVVAQIAPRPLLVVAAENDTICFPELGRELYEAAGEPRSYWLAPRAEHLAILLEAPTDLMDRVTRHFDQAGPEGP